MAEGQFMEGRKKEKVSGLSRESGYWGDDYSEMCMGLEQIKALGDVLVIVINSNMADHKQTEGPDVSLFDLADDTLPTLGHLIQEKAERIKTLLGKYYVTLSGLSIQ